MSNRDNASSELISPAWNFDPALPVDQYRQNWQKAETMAKSELLSLESDATMPDASFLKRLDRLLALLDIQENEAGLWQNYHPEADMRQEAEVIGSAVASLQLEISSSPRMAQLLEDVPRSGLDAMAARYHKFAMRDARRAGAFLDDANRSHFRSNAGELQEVLQAFQRNINQDSSHLMVSPDILDPMPEDFKVSHLVDPASGKVKISVAPSDYFPFMEYCEDDNAKEELFKLDVNRAPENEELLKRMVELRHQQARLLGYSSFAQYSMETCMLSDPVTTRSTMVEINDRARKLSEREKRSLADIMGKKGTELKAWNRLYAKAQLLQSKFPEFDPLIARQYFPFKRVVSGIMKLLEDLFSIEFREVQGVEVWHPTVRVFDIYDKAPVDYMHGKLPAIGDGAPGSRGRVFVDLLTRDNKNSHPYTFPIRNSAAGGPLVPTVALGDCFGIDEGACVDLDQCAALLHELGHCVHFLMAQNSEYYRFNGISVEQDFGEAPSNLLEELMQRSDIVQRVAVNEVGQSLPPQYLEVLLAGSALEKNMGIRSQTLYSLFSLDIHANLDEDGNFKGHTRDFTKASFEAYGNFGYIPGSNSQHAFTHIGVYDCRYFGYVSCTAIVKDLIQKLLGEGFSPAMGLQYRRAVLEPGSTKDSVQLIRDFLGRDYSYDPFYKWMESEDL